MKRKIFFLIISFFICINVKAIEIEISSPSAILIDQNTGTILYNKNEHEKRSMASMTKIMSLILIMEKINDGTINYDTEIEISKEASSMGGSQIFLREGDKYKAEELIKSIAMASANDSVVAMAEKTYGSVEAFVETMNKKAKELGLKNTHFMNVHGLDEEGHYSSAYDMAMMSKELLKYEDILKYTSIYEEYLTKIDGSQLWLVNTNKLVRFYDGVDGLKTGYTKAAGYCLTATAKKNNLRLISVVMGEDSIEKRSADTVKLLNYGFNTYKVNIIKKKEEKIGKIKVENGKKEYTDVYLLNDAIELLKVNEKPSKYTFDLQINKVKAPVKRGDTVGKVYIYNKDNDFINKLDVVTKEDIPKANLWTLFKRNFQYSLVYKKR